MKKSIKNKSSIVRLVISNYGDDKISEIKVIHEKKAFLDSIEIIDMCLLENDNTIFFKKVRAKSMDIDDNTTFDIDYDSDGSFTVSTESNENRRVYRISGEYLKKVNSVRYKLKPEMYDLERANSITVKLKLEMIEHPAQTLDRYQNRRREITFTERKLIGDKLADVYSKICLDAKENIDSKKIYQVNRFLEYRSNFLMYFSMINNMLCYKLDVSELWRIEKKEQSKKNSAIKHIARELQSILSQTLTDKNSLIEEYNNNLPKYKNKIALYNQITLADIEQDVDKIIVIYSKLRHALMHYDYKFFNDLFLSDSLILDNNELRNLLDLNLFKVLGSVRDFKEVSNTTYLDNDDRIRIFNKSKKARSVYELYWMICERKNGFNKLINDFFVKEGLEDRELKKLINQEFEERIEFLRSAIKTREINGKKIQQKAIQNMKDELAINEEQWKDIGEAYIDDIHYSKTYKLLYNKHQTLCDEVNKCIAAGNMRCKITELNKEINQSKIIMKKMPTTLENFSIKL